MGRLNEEKKAKLLLMAVVCFWGLNVVMIKYLTEFFDPITLAAWRIGAAMVLLVVMLWKSSGFVKVSAREWVFISGIAVSGIALHQITLSLGLHQTEATTGGLILGLNPLCTMVLAYLIFREPLTPRKIIGVLLGLCGVMVVVIGNSWEHLGKIAFGKGETLVLISMLAYVISGMFIKKATQTVPVLAVTTYSHVIATVLLVITTLVRDGLSDQPTSTLPGDWFVWGVLLFSGFVATALGSVWWNSGIRVIGAGRTSMYLNANPIWGLVFAMIFLGERIGWIHIFGFAAVFIAILLGTSQVKPRPQAKGASTV